MANVIPNSFRGELFSGVHNFASGGNDFKIALYTGTIAAVYTTASTTVSGTNVEEVTTQDNLCLRKQLHLQQLLLQLTLEIQLGQVQRSQQRLQLFIMIQLRVIR